MVMLLPLSAGAESVALFVEGLGMEGVMGCWWGNDGNDSCAGSVAQYRIQSTDPLLTCHGLNYINDYIYNRPR